MKKRARVTFVSPTLYPVFSGRSEYAVAGGAEVQQRQIIHLLRDHGYETGIITLNFGQPPGREVIDGVVVDKLPTVGNRGIKGLRFIHPRLTDYLPLLDQQRPDIIYTRTAGGQVAACAYHAWRRGCKLVYAGANDMEFGRERIPGVSDRDTHLFRWGLKRADAVVAQNREQSESLQRHWGRDAVVIPNTLEDPLHQPASFDGPVLLVGTVKPLKRPELFVRLAQAVPDRQFRIVGGPPGDEEGRRYYDVIRQAAAAVPNLKLVGFVPYRQVGAEFDGAAVLVNTSETEGFPNTFLQAWLRGVPTLSFVAPSGAGGQSGTMQAEDFDHMVQLLQQLTHDRSFWQRASDRGHSQYLAEHTSAAAVQAYEALIARLCG